MEVTMLTHSEVNRGSRYLIVWDSFQKTWTCRTCFNFNHWHERGNCPAARCHCSL
jgi:hypothetical protein